MPRPETADVLRRARLVVAVDGPSGSGKSSVCREVARRLGLSYLDTGAMYRAVCWSCIHRGIDLSDEATVADRAARIELTVSLDPDVRLVVVDGVDVTSAIRTSAISLAVSEVARNHAVRAELARRQRTLMAADPAGCVAEGRDITTVVAPDADVRILLTADAAARISRRAVELHGHDDAEVRIATAAEVTGRDARDAAVVDFESAGEGVVSIDTSRLDLAQTVDLVIAEILATASADGSGGPDYVVTIDDAVGVAVAGRGQA